MRTIINATTGKIAIDAAWQPEPSPPTPPPSFVTRRQLRLWLVRHGYALKAIEALIDALPEPQRTEARIEWEDAAQFERTHPLLQMLAGALLKLDGKALQEKIDDAFREAAAI